MSFENFPRDAYESWNEVGLVYTRNKYGRVSSPPGYGLKEGNDFSYKNSLFRGASCSVNTDDNIYNPQSLLLICLDYVAKNISMVESLEGFPDIVGEQLFKKVQENKGFSSNPKNLKLFCEAYGELVLSRLSLTSEHLLTSNYLECLQLFVYLTELDVSHCHLGDTHELLSYISHLHCLTKLSLKDNCLSDTGVKKFTLPQRLLKDGLGRLSVLDLSLNPGVCDNSIKYLVKITSLTALNLSGTGVTFGCGVPQLVNQTNLCLTLEIDSFKANKAFTVTEGWAVDVVNDWSKKSKCCATSNKTNTPAVKRSKFYKTTRSGVIQKSAEAKKSTTPSPSEHPLILLTLKENKRTSCAQSRVILPHVTNCTRSNKENSARNGQPRKKLKTSGDFSNSSHVVSADEVLEDDLFKEYLNYNNNCKPVRKHCSLLDSLDCIS